jgi:hypothetical protein
VKLDVHLTVTRDLDNARAIVRERPLERRAKRGDIFDPLV